MASAYYKTTLYLSGTRATVNITRGVIRYKTQMLTCALARGKMTLAASAPRIITARKKSCAYMCHRNKGRKRATYESSIWKNCEEEEEE